MSQSISRRTALAGLPVAAAAASLTALPSLAEMVTDAHLLHLGEQHDMAYAAHDFIANQTGARDEDIYEAIGRCQAITRQMEAIPARTMDGLRVKARAIERIHEGSGEPISLNEQQCTDVRLAQSIVADLLATPARAASLSYDPTADAVLIAPSRRSITHMYPHFKKGLAAMAPVKANEEAFSRACEKCHRIADQILAAPANSPDELLIKLKVAIWDEVALELDELDDWHAKNSPIDEDNRALCSLCELREDVRRLAGRNV